MVINSSQSYNEIIKNFLEGITQKGVVNFRVTKDSVGTIVLIHFEPAKKIMKYFIMFMMIIGVPTILAVPANPVIKITAFLILPIIFFLQNRIYIKITRYTDGKVEMVKQGSFVKKTFILQPNSQPHIIAQYRRWVGNRQLNDMYELVLAYTDETGSEKKSSSAFDDRKLFFQGGRNNIRGVLREEEIREIAKELELPYSANNS